MRRGWVFAEPGVATCPTWGTHRPREDVWATRWHFKTTKMLIFSAISPLPWFQSSLTELQIDQEIVYIHGDGLKCVLLCWCPGCLCVHQGSTGRNLRYWISTDWTCFFLWSSLAEVFRIRSLFTGTQMDEIIHNKMLGIWINLWWRLYILQMLILAKKISQHKNTLTSA